MDDFKRFSFQVTKSDLVDGERAIVHIITTDSVDRYKDVVLPKGGKLENYRKNPVVLLHHENLRVPIGRNLWIKPSGDGRGLVAKTIFATNDEAEEVYQLYRERVLNAWSIGMRPIKGAPPTEADIRGRPDWAGCAWIYREWELLEYSAVDIPANPDAVTLAVSKGLVLPKWLKADPPPAPAPSPAPESLPAFRTLAEVEAGLGTRLRAYDWSGVAAKAARDSLDRLRGRV